MVEQFSSFVKEALEFLSLLRASEKERFETEKKFMTETTNILKELAESVKKNNDLIKSSLNSIEQSIDTQIKRIEEKIGVDKLNQAIKAMEISVDLLQRGSTMLDYKYTVQKTRDLLDNIKDVISSSQTSSVHTSSQNSPVNPNTPKIHPSSNTTKATTPSQKVIQTPSPAPPQPKPTETIKTSAPEPESSLPSKSFSSVDAMMGTRTRAPRRVVNLKKPPTTKVITSKGEPIEIEVGSDEDEE